MISLKLMSNTSKTPLKCGVVIKKAGNLKDIGFIWLRVWTKIGFQTGLRTDSCK
jgi:hypothetical protein